VERDPERFEQGTDWISDGWWQRVTTDRGPCDPLAQTPISWSQPRETHGRAESPAATKTQVAAAARIGGIDRHAFAMARTVLDHSRQLVAWHEGGLHHAFANGAVFIPVQV
jgi:hypothetical protein